MKSFLFAMLLSITAFAQDTAKINILDLCKANTMSSETGISLVKMEAKSLLIIDKGFCSEFLKIETEDQVAKTVNQLSVPLDASLNDNCENEIEVKPVDPKIIKTDKWKLRFYASNSFTTYFPTDIKFRTSRYQVDIQDYQWAERSSRAFYNPKTWSEPGNNPFQMIDEPTNTFTASLEKNGHEFFLSIFHPKFIQQDNQNKYMSGTIDGTPVNGVYPIDKQFDGYDQVPGESEVIGNENTHRQLTFELGYGHRFNIVKGKFGSITYVPSFGLGLMMGHNLSQVIKPNEWWECDEYQSSYGVEGFGGSLTNRLEFNTPKERFGIFVENKLAYYHQKHDFLDGTQEYNLALMGNSVGVKFMLYNPNKRKKK